MPIIKSAQKRMRQEIVRRTRNRAIKDELRDITKKFAAAVEKKDTKKIGETLNKLMSQLDKAVKKNLMHKNTAARKKAAASKKAATAGYKPTETKKAAAKKPATKKAPAKKPAAKKSTAKKAPAKKKPAAKK